MNYMAKINSVITITKNKWCDFDAPTTGILGAKINK